MPQDTEHRHRPIARRTMADQLADTLTEEIVRGDRQPLDPLPTEPELCEEFSVSRSVVRDAMRMLAARGLVRVEHGRGAFVTESGLDAFAEALLLALRREEATAWEVEEFFQRFLPDGFALAAQRATAEDIRAIEQATEAYIETFRRVADATMSTKRDATAPEIEAIRSAFSSFTHAILAATHNTVFRLLAGPIERLRSLRNWDITGLDSDRAVEIEASGLREIAEAIATHEPDSVRRAISGWFDLPDDAVEAMKKTPAGATVDVPLSLEAIARKPVDL